MYQYNMYTHLKFNSSPLKSYHPKRKIIFQPSIFMGELLNFGGEIYLSSTSSASHIDIGDSVRTKISSQDNVHFQVSNGLGIQLK